MSKIDSKLVLRIDPVTNSVIAGIPVGSKPELGLGMGLGAVWIADTVDHTVTRIDPKTNQVVGSFPADIPEETEGSIGVGADSIWVLTGKDSDTLSPLDPNSGRVIAKLGVRPKSHVAVVDLRFGMDLQYRCIGGATR